MTDRTDRVIRAMTNDGAFRVMAARTTDLVAKGIATHELSGNNAQTFGEFLTALLLVRETMSPQHRMQAIFGSPGYAAMVGDSRMEGGRTRGLVNRGENAGPFQLDDDTVLKVIRTLHGGKLHQSIVGTGRDSVSKAFMVYMQSSEQVAATLNVRVVMDGSRVIAAGGFVVQLLPELEEGPLAVMTLRLDDFTDLAPLIVNNDNAQWLIDELTYGWETTILDDSPLNYGCDHGPERAIGALMTLPKTDIQDMVNKGKPIEMSCSYCREDFSVGTEQLKTLLLPS